ncbi:hypothetical protein [Maricaulis sp. CAU 1757]
MSQNTVIRLTVTGLAAALALYSLRYLLAGLLSQAGIEGALWTNPAVSADIAAREWPYLVRRVLVIAGFCAVAVSVWVRPSVSFGLVVLLILNHAASWVMSATDAAGNAAHAHIDAGGVPVTLIITVARWVMLVVLLGLTLSVMFNPSRPAR